MVLNEMFAPGFRTSVNHRLSNLLRTFVIEPNRTAVENLRQTMIRFLTAYSTISAVLCRLSFCIRLAR